MATDSSILAWRMPQTEEPGWLQSMGRRESDMTELLNAHTHSIKEWLLGVSGAQGWRITWLSYLTRTHTASKSVRCLRNAGLTHYMTELLNAHTHGIKEWLLGDSGTQGWCVTWRVSQSCRALAPADVDYDHLFFSPICIRIHFWIINNYHIVYLIMLNIALLKTLNKKHNLKLSHYLKSQEAIRIYKYMFNIFRHRIYSGLLILSQQTISVWWEDMRLFICTISGKNLCTSHQS